MPGSDAAYNTTRLEIEILQVHEVPGADAAAKCAGLPASPHQLQLNQAHSGKQHLLQANIPHSHAISRKICV